MFKLNPYLKDFWRANKPYKLLKGGRFSSKTQDAAGFALYLAMNCSLRIVCLRQYQNRITDSVYTVLKNKIIESNLENEFEIMASSIRHKKTNSEFIFYGIARNIAEIKGLEGVDVCWIEEGEGLTEDQWMVIDPTIRKEGAQIWLLWNPRRVTDFIECKLPKLLKGKCVIKHINYTDNPFLSNAALAKAEQLKDVDYELYEHIYLGVPLNDDDASIIKRTWILAAIDAHKKLPTLDWKNHRGCVGYDVADSGDDENAVTAMRGRICIDVESWKAREDELDKSAARVVKISSKHGVPLIGYDCIGVGASTSVHFRNAKKKMEDVFKFNASATVKYPERRYALTEVANKDMFSNLKAQSWWYVADLFRNTFNAVNKGYKIEPSKMISIDSSRISAETVEQLVYELSIVGKDFDLQGKVKAESKKDLKKRGIASPNLADSFIIAASSTLIKRPSLKSML